MCRLGCAIPTSPCCRSRSPSREAMPAHGPCGSPGSGPCAWWAARDSCARSLGELPPSTRDPAAFASTARLPARRSSAAPRGIGSTRKASRRWRIRGNSIDVHSPTARAAPRGRGSTFGHRPERTRLDSPTRRPATRASRSVQWWSSASIRHVGPTAAARRRSVVTSTASMTSASATYIASQPRTVSLSSHARASRRRWP
jgi:hypothetical protein